MPTIVFEREHKSLDVLPGTNLRKAALKSGIHLYSPFWRVFHANLQLGPVSFPCAADVVAIDGKGVNARTEEEEMLIAGRYLVKRKVTPELRLACQVSVTGDIRVTTRPAREIDWAETKRAVQYALVVGFFSVALLVTFALIALDLVSKL
jgi:ferredoxin